MSFKKIATWLVFISLVAVALAFNGCGSANPSVLPAETPLPIALKYNERSDYSIGLESTAREQTLAQNVYHAVGPGGEYSDAIPIGAELTSEMELLIDRFLTGISSLEMTGTTETTSFAGTMTLGEGGDVSTADALVIFGDYDFDNDGATEGCSGNITRWRTAAEFIEKDPAKARPVCTRAWIDEGNGYTRLVAWIFDVPPSEDGSNAGRSRFKFAVDTSSPAIDVMQYLHINFDQIDVEDRSLEFFMKIASEQTEFLSESFRHTEIDALGPDATALKTVNLSQITSYTPKIGIPVPDQLLNYLGRFRESYDRWSGSLDGSQVVLDALGLTPFANACAVISTGVGTSEGECADVGGVDIRVGTTPFTRDATDADTALPEAFTATPPAEFLP